MTRTVSVGVEADVNVGIVRSKREVVTGDHICREHPRNEIASHSLLDNVRPVRDGQRKVST